MSKKKKEDNLDTETTFANMNVEGFKWYTPKPKNSENKVRRKVSRKEYWQMVFGAYKAMLPFVLIFVLSLAVVAVLMYLWLAL